ncbi:MAG: 30S ribosomal protein S1 [Ruminococcaceae bacterium]|nr:30S ribosomal protein S1 [Oscillospiraceae bacterium]
MKYQYCYEGKLLKTEQNRYYTQNSDTLAEAMEREIILEGISYLCDHDRHLHIRLGDMEGIIPRSECVYTQSGLPEKDIAIISRVGKPVCFKVMGIEKDENGNVKAICSRREAQMDCMRNKIEFLETGDVIEARITRLDPFGAFCDIGCGVISLLPIDCMSVSRISHPRDRFRNGQVIKVVVKNKADDFGRITLTHRELLGTWEENAARFTSGQTAAGIIRSIEDYGVFVELAPNLAGLAECRSDVAVGQSAAVFIKNIIPDRMKVKLAIIDCMDSETTVPDYEYPDISHIDRWKYSPEGCEKVIESIFNSGE